MNKVFFFIVLLFLASCSGYTKRDGKVYFKQANELGLGYSLRLIDSADYESFEQIEDDLAKDKFHVFYEMSIIHEANPNTFKQVKDLYWKDARHVFLIRQGPTFIINNADPNSFKVLGDYEWALDKKNVYYRFDTCKKADPRSFYPIDENWGKDNNYFYHHNERIDSAAYNSVKIVSEDYLKDRNHVFYHNKLVVGCNPNTFCPDGAGFFGHDDRFMYDEEKNVGEITQDYRKTYIDN